MDSDTRLIGIYEAEGSLLGELRYVVGKLRGTRHCSLCDITHGRVRKKPAFAALEQRLPVAIDLLHLDELSPRLQAASAGHTPCVLIDDAAGLRVLLSRAELEEHAGSVEAFERALLAKLATSSTMPSGT